MSINKAEWHEDGGCTLLARVCARDATGAATGVRGEGRWLKQADLSSISYSVFDRSSSTPETATSGPTSLTISTVIQDTPVTNGEIWDVDEVGYNFVADMAGTLFPTGGHQYSVEVTFTTTGGTTWTEEWKGPALARSTG